MVVALRLPLILLRMTVPNKEEDQETLRERRQKHKDLFKGCDKTKPMTHPSNLQKLMKDGLIKRNHRGKLMWTREGKIAKGETFREEKHKALLEGKPWPPSKDYFKKIRNLRHENQNDAEERF
jgi:serine/threonine-protein kinase RIO1